MTLMSDLADEVNRLRVSPFARKKFLEILRKGYDQGMKTGQEGKRALRPQQRQTNDFVATSSRSGYDDYFVRQTFSCGPTDGLVTVTMTRADFERDYVEPLVRKLKQ